MLTPLFDITAERLLWRYQFRALGRSLSSQIRRVLRREARWYLTIDGRVVARFESEGDYRAFMSWLAHGHSETFRMGHEWGEAAGQLAHDQ